MARPPQQNRKIRSEGPIADHGTGDTRSTAEHGNAVRSLAEEAMGRLARRQNQAQDSASADDISALAEAYASDDPSAGETMVAALHDKGVPLETLYLVYLAGAARRLGEWWVNDRLSFSDVTIATGRIFGTMRSLRQDTGAIPQGYGPTVVFATVPGEEHTLGVAMAADLARIRGWHVKLILGGSQQALVSAVSEGDCRLCGVSASSSRMLPALRRLVGELRAACKGVPIMICGHVLDVAEAEVARLPVDATAEDLSVALRMLEALAVEPGPPDGA